MDVRLFTVCTHCHFCTRRWCPNHRATHCFSLRGGIDCWMVDLRRDCILRDRTVWRQSRAILRRILLAKTISLWNVTSGFRPDLRGSISPRLDGGNRHGVSVCRVDPIPGNLNDCGSFSILCGMICRIATARTIVIAQYGTIYLRIPLVTGLADCLLFGILSKTIMITGQCRIFLSRSVASATSKPKINGEQSYGDRDSKRCFPSFSCP